MKATSAEMVVKKGHRNYHTCTQAFQGVRCASYGRISTQKKSARTWGLVVATERLEMVVRRQESEETSELQLAKAL